MTIKLSRLDNGALLSLSLDTLQLIMEEAGENEVPDRDSVLGWSGSAINYLAELEKHTIVTDGEITVRKIVDKQFQEGLLSL